MVRTYSRPIGSNYFYSTLKNGLCLKIDRWSINKKWVWAVRISIQFHFQVNRVFFIEHIHRLVFKNVSAWSDLEFCWNPSFLKWIRNIVAILATDILWWTTINYFTMLRPHKFVTGMKDFACCNNVLMSMEL